MSVDPKHVRYARHVGHYIHKDEWYPVLILSDTGLKICPPELRERYLHAWRLFF